MSDIAGSTEFKITNTILHVLIVSFSTKDNVKLTKKLNLKDLFTGMSIKQNRIKRFKWSESYKSLSWCFFSSS